MEQRPMKLRHKAVEKIKQARLRAAKRILRKFGRDEEGSMVVFTLFLILMMILMGGVAVDMMRFETNRTRLQGAIDRAVLAAADLDVCLDPSANVQAVVENYVATAGFPGLVGQVDVVRGFNSCQVTADARIDVNTIFLAMVSVDQLGTPASSGATESLGDVEVSIVLDVSGSMGTGGRIEALRPAASEFVETIMDTVEEGFATISIVPYSTQVNLGPTIRDQFLTRYTHDRSFCIDLPSTLYNRTDIPMQTRYDQGAHFDPFSGAGTGGITVATHFNCNEDPESRIFPFSDDVGAMQTFINALQPDMNTSTEMGAKWGIAMLDPEFRPVTTALVGAGDVEAQYARRPLDFNTQTTLKVMVLMSDGANTTDFIMRPEYRDRPSDIWIETRTDGNEQFYIDVAEINDTDRDGRWRERYGVTNETTPNWGWNSRWWTNTRQGERMNWDNVWAMIGTRSQAYNFRYLMSGNWNDYLDWRDDIVIPTSRAAKDVRLLQLCTAAKDRGIVIFTIGFQLQDNAAAQLMSDCATSPNHFYRIADLDIDSAFDSIANQISQLRLIQ